MKVTPTKIIATYRELGRENDYLFAKRYVLFLRKYKGNISQTVAGLGIEPSTASRWLANKQTPYPIKTINELEKRGLLNIKVDCKLARLVGALHGDGFLYNSLRGFGVTNTELCFIERFRQDVFEFFKIESGIRKIRDVGDIEMIHGKKVLVKKPTYQVRFNSKALGIFLYICGVPRGIKTNQPYVVPDWIMNGTKSVQRAFLQAFFDSDISNSSISSYGSHKQNLSSPRLEMAKVNQFEQNLYGYLTQVKQLLLNFNVESKVSYRRNYSERKLSYTLVISNRLVNILNLIKHIGFYYSDNKKNQAEKIKCLIFQKMRKQKINVI